MSEEPRKRSRFDQTEPEPRKASRFDKRSRSPSTRKPEPRRSRSPVSGSPATPGTGEKKLDAAAAAAAAAAKINAQLLARTGIQQVDAPPIRSSSTPTPAAENRDGEIYQQDGDYIKDIEVNDLRNRYTLTKGSTQKMIKDETGADVTTRGSYYPDKSMATAANPPLYLHVTSQTKEGLEKAMHKIDELMQQELPNLIDERRFRRREPEQVERDELGRRKWPEERIAIDLEPIPGFNLRAQVVGAGGAYVKHIQNETRCRVQIKGQGSGFTESTTGMESDEPMYLHVAGPDPNMVARAKELCEDLIKNVKDQYQQFKARGPRYGGGDRGGRGGYGQRESSYGGHRDNRDDVRGGYGHTSSADTYAGGAPMSPGAQGSSGSATAQDYAAQYAQYYGAQAGGADPYAAYGGYQNYMAYYQYYYGQQAQQAGAPGADTAGATFSSPPPPPAGGTQSYQSQPPPPGVANAPPPPPPPAGSPPGPESYSAVPPPSGY